MTPAEASVTRTPSSGDLLVEAIRRLGVHDHLCLIYDREEERLRTLLPFFAAGLARGERCVYIADGETAAGGLDLLEGLGADVPQALSRGQLQVLTKRDAYLRHGMFDPDSMIDLLAETVRQAHADGFSALRVTGEMTWALRGEPGSERLIEYESKLNRFFPRADAVAICQYDRRWFRPELIKEVIETHPLVIHGDRVCRNFYYVPPEEFLGPQAPEHEVQRLLDNIAARELQEEALRSAETRFRSLWDSGVVGVIEADLEGRILDANDAFLDIVGHTRDDLRAGELRWDRLTPPDHMARTAQSVSDLRRTGLSNAYEKQYLRKDGRRVWVMIGSAILEEPDGRALAFVVDVDARRRAEAELRRVERALRAVVACQQALVRAADELVLMTEVCRLLVDVGGYRMAWAGWAEDDPECTIRPVAHSGFDSGYVETLNLSWSGLGERGRGPTTAAIRTGTRQVVPDIAAEPSFGPWRDQALRRGYRSSASLPLRVGPRVVGTLNLYAEAPDAFDPEELALLDQLAADLSFGISVVRDADSRRRQARQLDAFFAHTITPLVFLDPRFNFVRVNEAYARVCGRPIEDFAGRNHFDLYPSDAKAIFEEVVRTRRPRSFQARPFEFADHPEWGTTFWDWSLVPVLDEVGRVEFLVYSLNDVTARSRAEQALREAHGYTRGLLEASVDALATIDPAGAITDVNERMCQVTGRTRAELVGSPFRDCFQDAERAAEGVRRVLAEGSVLDYELALRGPDRVLPVSYNATVYRGPGGEVRGVFAAARDITDRKRAEEALAARARQQAAVAELGTQALGTEDMEAVMGSAVRLLATTLDVECAKVLELLPGGDALLLRAGVGWGEGLVGRATVPAGPESHAGYTLLRTEPVVVEDLASEARFRGMSLLHEHGLVSGMGVVIGSPEAPAGVLGAYTSRPRRFTDDDVNFMRAVANVLGTALARHRAQQVAEREATLVRMLQAAAVAANEADSVEEAARRMLAHVCEETGWPVGHLFHVHRHPEPVAVSSSVWHLSDPRYELLRRATEGVTVPTGFGLVGRVLDTGAPQWSDDAAAEVLPLRAPAVRGSGLRTWMAFPVLTRTSEVVAVAEFFSPERLRPDLRLLEAMGHVGTQLGRVVERQRAEERLARYARDLERSNQDLQEFAGVASHDMQEPLRKVVAFGDRLAEHAAGALDATALDDLRRMQAAAGRMSTLIESLLELSRVSTRRKAVAPTDLRAVMTEVLADLEERIRSSGARVDVGALPAIRADAAQMRQLLQNLVSNALKFVARGTPPDIRVAARSAAGGFVEIAVTDNGIGFEERYLDRIFRPFQTLNPRGDYEGSGMGLAICRKIAERHGGSITARSRPGQGSTFVVSLPVRRSEEAR